MGREIDRTSCQGVWNVIYFNWLFYIVALAAVLIGLSLSFFVGPVLQWLLVLGVLSILLSTVLSLAATFWVYDYTGLYRFNWLKRKELSGNWIHLSAGFDETSDALSSQFVNCRFHRLDFYEALGEKEISIQRARKKYPLSKDAVEVSLQRLPFEDKEIDGVVAIFAAHEIRTLDDRVLFFKEISRVSKDHCRLYIVEHLRDWKNFVAYNVGFLHFLSKESWLQTFEESGWEVVEEKKHASLVSIFILEKKHGNLS